MKAKIPLTLLFLLSFSQISRAETHYFDTLNLGEKKPFENFLQGITDRFPTALNPFIIRLKSWPLLTHKMKDDLYYKKLVSSEIPGAVCMILMRDENTDLRFDRIFRLKPINFKLKEAVYESGQKEKILATMINLVEQEEFINNGSHDYKDKLNGLTLGYGCNINAEGWTTSASNYRWLKPLTSGHFTEPAECVPETKCEQKYAKVVRQVYKED